MNKKNKTVVFIICIFLLVTLGIVYIFSELFSENDRPPITTVTDAYKFKNEYESVNGEEQGDYKIRSLTIKDNNPFVYKTPAELLKMIDEKNTFVVYFGFNTCPWCRSVLPSLIDAALEKDVKKIYYVDVKDIRDTYELNDNHEAVRTKEGTEDYYKLLEKLSPVLSDYSPLTYETKKGKTKEVKIDEKRIYAPNIVVVKNGEAIALESGEVESLTNPYMEITTEMDCEIKEIYKCLFDRLTTDSDVCSIDNKKC